MRRKYFSTLSFLLFVCISNGFSLDSLFINGSFGFTPGFASGYDWSVGADFHFKGKFYSRHLLLSDRLGVVNQLSSIGVGNQYSRIGLLVALKYNTAYSDGFIFAPGLEGFLGFPNATNFEWRFAYWSSEEEGKTSRVYIVYNGQLQLGAKAFRFAAITGAIPFDNMASFYYQSQYKDFGRLLAYNADMYLGFRSNSFFRSQIGLFYAFPIFTHKMPVKGIDYEIEAPGIVVEYKGNISERSAINVYAGYLFEFDNDGDAIPENKNTAVPMILKTNLTWKVF